MLFPYALDTLFKHRPITNWVIMTITVLAYALMSGGALSDELIYGMVLDGWSVGGLLGYGLLHTGIFHLAGNMVFLWVFGNAICGNTSNRAYPFLYVGFLLVSGGVHVLFDGEPAVGASGAINGVVGMALAMYPLNRVSVFYWLWFRVGTFLAPLWGIALVWLGFDLLGVLLGGAGTAYWAHLGGFFAGLATGYVALRVGWVKLTEIDYQSLEEIFSGKTAEARRERLRAEEAAENAAEFSATSGMSNGRDGPWSHQAAAAGDPLVMPATTATVAGWSRVARGAAVSAEDGALIEAGGADGRRKYFELLYGKSFFAQGYSFHRSLSAYYRCVADGRIWPHERAALADLLRMTEEDFEEMRETGFVDVELAALHDAARVPEFLRGGR